MLWRLDRPETLLRLHEEAADAPPVLSAAGEVLGFSAGRAPGGMAKAKCGAAECRHARECFTHALGGLARGAAEASQGGVLESRTAICLAVAPLVLDTADAGGWARLQGTSSAFG